MNTLIVLVAGFILGAFAHAIEEFGGLALLVAAVGYVATILAVLWIAYLGLGMVL